MSGLGRKIKNFAPYHQAWRSVALLGKLTEMQEIILLLSQHITFDQKWVQHWISWLIIRLFECLQAIESFFILYKTTGNVKWRERGWEIFQAIQKYAKTKHGYGSISNVNLPPHFPLDNMPRCARPLLAYGRFWYFIALSSFFLAETLKYLYLLFDDTDIIPLDKWVFNTEAHPLPTFEWTPEERERFGIPSEL